MNCIFSFNKYFFHFWLLASAGKMMALPDSGGELQPPATHPGLYAYRPQYKRQTYTVNDWLAFDSVEFKRFDAATLFCCLAAIARPRRLARYLRWGRGTVYWYARCTNASLSVILLTLIFLYKNTNNWHLCTVCSRDTSLLATMTDYYHYVRTV